MSFLDGCPTQLYTFSSFTLLKAKWVLLKLKMCCKKVKNQHKVEVNNLLALY
jgi:hypothetical protein